jgi:hypothetical protein
VPRSPPPKLWCRWQSHPILRTQGFGPGSAIKRKPKPKATHAHTEVLDGVRALGLTMATAAQVDAAIGQLFPNGTAGVDPGEVIRSVFLSLKAQDSRNNVAR